MNERILVVEDEAAIQSILYELLTDAGYAVTLAGDGPTGLARFREQAFSLVLLDIMLPGMDGYGVCERIRAESDVPVIMLTALDEERAQIQAFERRADDYITKPFSLKLVLMRVEAVLRRSALPKPAREILRYRNIRLDSLARLVTRDGEPVALTHIEYDLLELFLRNPGRVFTRDSLLNQVWGYDFVGEEKAVNIHIMNLRRKLGADCIDTIRGVGYRLARD
ncbi:MAG: response regulator transcription factor [Clostridia bacterium]|nr:response regulator transcription factor [Clostridia bacterium]